MPVTKKQKETFYQTDKTTCIFLLSQIKRINVQIELMLIGRCKG